MPFNSPAFARIDFYFNGQGSPRFLSEFIFPSPPETYAVDSPQGFVSSIQLPSVSDSEYNYPATRKPGAFLGPHKLPVNFNKSWNIFGTLDASRNFNKPWKLQGAPEPFWKQYILFLH